MRFKFVGILPSSQDEEEQKKKNKKKGYSFVGLVDDLVSSHEKAPVAPEVTIPKIKLADKSPNLPMPKPKLELPKPSKWQAALPSFSNAMRVAQAPEDSYKTKEASFDEWYAQVAKQSGLSANPDDPQNFYDYRSAFKAGVRGPDGSGHWPSKFKKEGHPNTVVGGFDTRTGQRVPNTPQASEKELIALGWDPETAKKMSAPAPKKKIGNALGTALELGHALINPGAATRMMTRPEREIDRSGDAPLSAGDVFARLADPARLAKAMPIIGALKDGMDSAEALAAASRIERGQGTEADEAALKRYFADEEEIKRRGTTWGHTVANLVTYLPGFAAEMAWSGGSVTAAKKAASELGEITIRKALDIVAKKGLTQAAEKATATGLGKAVKTVAREGLETAARLATPAMAPRVAAAAIKEAAPNSREAYGLSMAHREQQWNMASAKAESEGKPAPTRESMGLPDAPVEQIWEPDVKGSLVRGIVSSGIEVFTEGMGKYLDPAAKAVFAKIPGSQKVEAIKSLAMKQWLRLNPSKTVSDWLTWAGQAGRIDGPIGESLEERMGEILHELTLKEQGDTSPASIRLVTGAQEDPNNPVANPRIEAFKQLAVQMSQELAAFSVFPAGKKLMDLVTHKPTRRTEPEVDFELKYSTDNRVVPEAGTYPQPRVADYERPPITPEMKAELKTRGFAPEDIHVMDPIQAESILMQQPVPENEKAGQALGDGWRWSGRPDVAYKVNSDGTSIGVSFMGRNGTKAAFVIGNRGDLTDDPADAWVPKTPEEAREGLRLLDQRSRFDVNDPVAQPLDHQIWALVHGGAVGTRRTPLPEAPGAPVWSQPAEAEKPAEPLVEPPLPSRAVDPTPVEAAEAAAGLTAEEERVNTFDDRAIPVASAKEVIPGGTYRVPISELSVDAKRLQYKANADTEGVIPSNRIEGPWDKYSAGVIIAWKDPADGKLYVVNGHHRVEGGKRLGAEDMLVQVLDDMPIERARVVGAITNINENNGTAVDAAKIIRGSGMGQDELRKSGLNERSKVAKDGHAIAKLSDPLFQRVAMGELTEDIGAAIGAAGLSDDQQMKVVKLIERAESKGRDVSRGTVVRLAALAKSAEDIAAGSAPQGSLWGDDEDTQSTALELADVTEWLGKELSKRKTALGAVTKSGRAATITETGVGKINVEKAKKLEAEEAQNKAIFERLANKKGPLNEALKAAAVRIASGENSDVVRQELFPVAQAAIKAELTGKPIPANQAADTRGTPGRGTTSPKTDGNRSRAPEVTDDIGPEPPFGDPGTLERAEQIAWRHGKTWREKTKKLEAIQRKFPDGKGYNWDHWEADTKVRSAKDAQAEIEYFKEREQESKKAIADRKDKFDEAIESARNNAAESIPKSIQGDDRESLIHVGMVRQLYSVAEALGLDYKQAQDYAAKKYGWASWQEMADDADRWSQNITREPPKRDVAPDPENVTTEPPKDEDKKAEPVRESALKAEYRDVIRRVTGEGPSHKETRKNNPIGRFSEEEFEEFWSDMLFSYEESELAEKNIPNMFYRWRESKAEEARIAKEIEAEEARNKADQERGDAAKEKYKKDKAKRAADERKDRKKAAKAKADEIENEPKLPADLAKSNPTYRYGKNGFNLEFESDVDRAAFIVASEKTVSPRNADFVDFVAKAKGFTDEQVIEYGRQIKDYIKNAARNRQIGHRISVDPDRADPIRVPRGAAYVDEDAVDKTILGMSSMFDLDDEGEPKVDKLKTGEDQPRLPGDVGDVRDREVPDPKVAEVPEQEPLKVGMHIVTPDGGGPVTDIIGDKVFVRIRNTPKPYPRDKASKEYRRYEPFEETKSEPADSGFTLFAPQPAPKTKAKINKKQASLFGLGDELGMSATAATADEADMEDEPQSDVEALQEELEFPRNIMDSLAYFELAKRDAARPWQKGDFPISEARASTMVRHVFSLELVADHRRSRFMRAMLGAARQAYPVVKGRVRRGALGTYHTKTGLIRLLESVNLDVLMHELGHMVDFRIWGANDRPAFVVDELVSLGVRTSGRNRDPIYLATEGIAEYFRIWNASPEVAEQLAPGYTQSFNDYMNRNPVQATQLLAAQQIVQRYLSQPLNVRASTRVEHYRTAMEHLKDTLAEASTAKRLGDDRNLVSRFVAAHEALEGLQPGNARSVVHDAFIRQWIDRHVDIQRARDNMNYMADQDGNIIQRHMLTLENDAYSLRRLADRSDAAAMGMVRFGIRGMGDQFLSEGLEASVALVGDRVTDLNEYLVALAARELHTDGKGRNPGMTLEEADSIIDKINKDKDRPLFEDARDGIYKFTEAMLEYAVNGGLISQEESDRMSTREFYVPLQRVIETSSGVARGHASPFKHMTKDGSALPVISPIDSIVRNVASLVYAVETNRSDAALARQAISTPLVGHIMTEVSPDKVPVTFNLANLAGEVSKRTREAFIEYKLEQARRPMGKKSTLVKNLTSAEEAKIRAEAIAEFKDMRITSPEALEGIVTIFQPKIFQDGKNRLLAVKIDGEKRFFQVHDDALWRNFEKREDQRNKAERMFIGAMNWAATMLRTGATIRPSFIVANLVRDSLVAMFQSRHGFIFGWDTSRGIKSVLTKDKYYRLAMTRGVSGSTLLGGDRKHVDAAVRKMKTTSTVKSGYELIRHPINALQRLSELIETATRVSEFRLALENVNPKDRRVGVIGIAQRLGDSFAGRISNGDYTEEQLLRAAMAAADVTTDFSRGGDAAKDISKVKSFFNARIQGWVRMADTYNRDKSGTFLTLGLVMTLAYYLYHHNKDDQEYLELSDDERRRFFFFSTGKGQGIKIAKPFDWAIPANLVEYALLNKDTKSPIGQDMVKAFGMFDPTAKLGEDVVFGGAPRRLAAHLATSFFPTLFFPAIEAMTNYDTFRERPIYDPKLEEANVDLQVRDWTSDTARLLGPMMSMSPAVFEHLIHGYGGGLMRDTFMFTDYPARRFMQQQSRNRPEPPARQFVDQVPGLNSILWQKNYDTRSRANRDFYDTYKRLEGAEASIKKYEAQEGTADYPTMLEAFHKEFPEHRVVVLKEAKSAIDELLDLKRDIRSDGTLDPIEKRERLEEVDRAIISHARVALGRDPLR